MTPPDSTGLGLVGGVFATDPGGDRVIYFTWGPEPGGPSGSLFSYAMGTRGDRGWGTRQLGYPYTTEQISLDGPSVLGASTDLSTLIWGSPVPLVPAAPSDRAGIYRAAPGGAPTLLGSFARDGSLGFSRASEDGQHIAFQTTEQLLPADPDRMGGPGVYELTGSDLRLVSIDNGGAPLSACGGANLGVDQTTPVQPNPVSNDGRRIFMTSPEWECEGETRRVYLRDNGSTTIEVSASQCSRPDCNAAQDVTFMGATPSGSAVFLATAQQLTDDDVDEGVDLYRFDVSGGQLSRISVGPPDVAANVVPRGVFTSDDGSRVYFLAQGQLESGLGVEGEPNLYLIDDGDLRFVAALSAFDVWPDGIAAEAEITPDGEQMLLSTNMPLVPEDTDGWRDVYRYDAATGQTVLVSSGPAGGNGDFEADFTRGPFQIKGVAPRSFSEDGRHAFFWTSEPLLPQDSNSTIDVYEWFDGQLGLVTSGGETASLTYGGASADGRSVFFSTTSSLVGADRDGGDQDLYVARADGGFPDPPTPPASCDEQGTCPDPPVDRPRRPTPASVSAGEKALRVSSIGPAARRRIAATGRMTLLVRTTAPGSISARARARIGGRLRTVAEGSARAARAGKLRIRLRLSSAARRSLKRGNSLRLRVVLRHSRLDGSVALRLNLVGARRG